MSICQGRDTVITSKICPRCGGVVPRLPDGTFRCDRCQRMVESKVDPSWMIDQALYEGMAEVLAKKYGITQREKRTPTSQVCSIGYSERKKKWYGWSHRAIAGFGIGDGFFPEPGHDVDWDPPKEKDRPKIKSIEQAKQSAKNFASWVS